MCTMNIPGNGNVSMSLNETLHITFKQSRLMTYTPPGADNYFSPALPASGQAGYVWSGTAIQAGSIDVDDHHQTNEADTSVDDPEAEIEGGEIEPENEPENGREKGPLTGRSITIGNSAV